MVSLTGRRPQLLASRTASAYRSRQALAGRSVSSRPFQRRRPAAPYGVRLELAERRAGRVGRERACAASEQAPSFDAATLGVGIVEIGEPERTYTVEPLEDPVPRERPGEPGERPAGPSPAEEPVEPERVPAP
jgi:hypothetical protein